MTGTLVFSLAVIVIFYYKHTNYIKSKIKFIKYKYLLNNIINIFITVFKALI